ncbi:hypothetical protein GCM10008910_48700 [Faecalicatena orotica]|uniref:Uncharacterized protein n=1 Tax=Faecalicatena orotica TaxID=1544 RepID=A0A2Y9BHK6_9FIRM|nr:hypothetical protein [Faecalicatena orotica]PWJ28055.1 hypothetical protein A8806_110239 [Faecalicatena orotica]SSA57080.1 hypothetical protein SAMN05216536_110239 [Faecalicatena orotica]
MKKTWKKLLATLLSLVMMLSLSIPVMAEDTENQVAVPNEVIGLDNYITRSQDGTLHLDSDAAISAGYTETIADAITQHLEMVNELVTSGEAITDNDLNIYIISGGLTRAGVRKIVTYWWGQTDVYLSSSDAMVLVRALEAAGNSLANLISIVDNGSYDNIQNAALGYLVGAGLLAFAYGAQIRQVSGNGTAGIIQQNVLNYDTGTTVISYHPQ